MNKDKIIQEIDKRNFELRERTGDPHLSLKEKTAIYKQAKREIEEKYNKH